MNHKSGSLHYSVALNGLLNWCKVGAERVNKCWSLGVIILFMIIYYYNVTPVHVQKLNDTMTFHKEL